MAESDLIAGGTRQVESTTNAVAPVKRRRSSERTQKPSAESAAVQRRDPENTIHESKRRTRASRAADAPAAPSDERRTPTSSRRRLHQEQRTVPAEVEQRFVRVGHDFYFPDGARAFTDRGARLTTPSENTEVIGSLVSIAQARGWQEVTLSGTERFRKEAWMAAQLAGLSARGYKPTELEQERVVRALARASTARGEPDRDAAEHRTQEQDHSRERTAGSPRSTRRRDEAISGRLVDHGRAEYRHDPKAAMSYFVKLETERGDRTLWGVDLERALRESLSQPKIGDEVAIRAVRREPVTVKSSQRDAQGNVMGSKEIEAHRNRWVIEQRSFLEQRAAAARTFRDTDVSAREGARKHPELLGSYLQLHSAQELAAQRIRDPQDQQRFVGRVREVLADSIAQGEPLAPVRLRDRTARRETRVTEREAAAARA